MAITTKIQMDKSGDRQVVADGGIVLVESGGKIEFESGGLIAGAPQNIRTRLTVAQVNAGAILLAAVSGYTYRMISCKAIAVGGAAGAVTTVDVKSTQTTGVSLVAFAQASLTQSSVLTAGGSGAAVLADGASYVANDSGVGVTVIKVGSDVTTATHIDIIFDYVLEAA